MSPGTGLPRALDLDLDLLGSTVPTPRGPAKVPGLSFGPLEENDHVPFRYYLFGGLCVEEVGGQPRGSFHLAQ